MKTTSLLLLGALCLPANAQNVGIGTSTTDRAKLEVAGAFGSGTTSALFGSNAAGISLQRNRPAIGFNQYRDDFTPGSEGKYMANGFAAIQYMDPASGLYAFDLFPGGTSNSATPAGVRAMTVDGNGNTAIRTTHLNASLVAARGDGAEGTAVFTGPSYWSHFNYSTNEDTYIRAGVNGGTVHINKIPTGSILVGTTSAHLGINSGDPFFTIEVHQPSGQKAFTLVDRNNYRWAMACNFINTLDKGTGVALDFYYNNSGRGRFQFWDGAYVVLSDGKLKEKVEPLEPVLGKIEKLRTVKYEMTRHNPQLDESIGMIAQEVEPVFPMMVRKVKDHHGENPPIPDARVMDYTGFGVVAIKALQEQHHQLQLLEKEKQDLLDRLLKLEKSLHEN